MRCTLLRWIYNALLGDNITHKQVTPLPMQVYDID